MDKIFNYRSKIIGCRGSNVCLIHASFRRRWRARSSREGQFATRSSWEEHKLQMQGEKKCRSHAELFPVLLRLKRRHEGSEAQRRGRFDPEWKSLIKDPRSREADWLKSPPPTTNLRWVNFQIPFLWKAFISARHLRLFMAPSCWTSGCRLVIRQELKSESTCCSFSLRKIANKSKTKRLQLQDLTQWFWKCSHTLNFSTFCYITTTNFGMFRWDFMALHRPTSDRSVASLANWLLLFIVFF